MYTKYTKPWQKQLFCVKWVVSCATVYPSPLWEQDELRRISCSAPSDNSLMSTNPPLIVDHPKLKLGRKKNDGRRHNGKNFKGNSIEEGTHPAVVANRRELAINPKPRTAARRKKILTDATLDALDRTVIINGEESHLTVADLIVQQRAIEAMQPNDFNDTAHKATTMLWDRAEGRPVGRQEVSGPEGGPIETVDTHVVLAKLFS